MSLPVKKRAKSVTSDNKTNALFKLVDSVFEDEDLALLRDFYKAAKRRLRGAPCAEKMYKSVERNKNKFDVDFGFYVDLSKRALRAIKAVIGANKWDEQWTYGTPHALVTFCGAAQQVHTDAQPLFDSGLQTPQFLYTLLVNVGSKKITPDMGPTEFFGKDDGLNAKGSVPLLEPNQGVLFDGMVAHRATACVKEREPTIYIVFRRSWYRDPNQDEFDGMQKNI